MVEKNTASLFQKVGTFSVHAQFFILNISWMWFWIYLNIMKYFQRDYMVFQIICKKGTGTFGAFLFYYFKIIFRYVII